MKLARSLVMAMVVALIGLCAGCASNAPKPLSPSQIAAVACPPAEAALAQFVVLAGTLKATDPLYAKVQSDLVKAQPVVEALCAKGSTISLDSVQAFAQTALPALGEILVGLPIPPAQQAQIQAGLVVAEIAVGAVGAIEQQVEAAKAAPSSTVATPPK